MTRRSSRACCLLLPMLLPLAACGSVNDGSGAGPVKAAPPGDVCTPPEPVGTLPADFPIDLPLPDDVVLTRLEEGTTRLAELYTTKTVTQVYDPMLAVADERGYPQGKVENEAREAEIFFTLDGADARVLLSKARCPADATAILLRFTPAS